MKRDALRSSQALSFVDRWNWHIWQLLHLSHSKVVTNLGLGFSSDVSFILVPTLTVSLSFFFILNYWDFEKLFGGFHIFMFYCSFFVFLKSDHLCYLVSSSGAFYPLKIHLKENFILSHSWWRKTNLLAIH